MARINLPASRAAFLSVVIIVGGAFLWWYQNRPSYLLYQAYRELEGGNQAGVIAEYKRLLTKKDLPKDDEICLRRSLGEFYVRALQESNGISVLSSQTYEVENPFLAEAKKEFERIIELNSADASAHYYLGRILWFRHLESFAIEELNKSRTSDPKNPEPLWFLSLVHRERGDASLARELALQALAIKPDYDEARLALVESYAALGDHEDALKEFGRLSSSFRDNPDRKAQHALYLADENEWEDAMPLIEEAVKEAPNNGRVKIIYGRLLLERGLSEEASGQFAQSAALMPHNVWPLVWQVKAARMRGECEEAGRISRLLVEGLPRWGWSHLARAWSHLCRGDAAAALFELDEAQRLSTDLMEAKELNAVILLDQERFNELGKVIRPLLDQKKNESQAYAFLAQSFFLQRNYNMAAEMAESAIKCNQQNAQGFIWLGMARAYLKDAAGAGRAFENAQSLRPFDPIIQGYQMRAAESLRALLKTNARNAHLWLLLGDAYRFDKNWPEAVDAYQNALALEPWLLRGQLGLKEGLAWRDKVLKER